MEQAPLYATPVTRVVSNAVFISSLPRATASDGQGLLYPELVRGDQSALQSRALGFGGVHHQGGQHHAKGLTSSCRYGSARSRQAASSASAGVDSALTCPPALHATRHGRRVAREPRPRVLFHRAAGIGLANPQGRGSRQCRAPEAHRFVCGLRGLRIPTPCRQALQAR